MTSTNATSILGIKDDAVVAMRCWRQSYLVNSLVIFSQDCRRFALSQNIEPLVVLNEVVLVRPLIKGSVLIIVSLWPLVGCSSLTYIIDNRKFRRVLFQSLVRNEKRTCKPVTCRRKGAFNSTLEFNCLGCLVSSRIPASKAQAGRGVTIVQNLSQDMACILF